jgi:exoribonuclease R
MKNQLYEQRYSQVVEPTYGTKRDKVLDAVLELDIRPHEFSILTRTDMTKHESYSIDPIGCADADDAFSIFAEGGKMYLAIHIADPTEYIPLSSSLWRDMCNRVTTKYPSNRPPIHMMPTSVLSLASLQGTNIIKKAITVLSEINPDTYEIINEIKLLFTEICVREETRYTYEIASKNMDTVDTLKHGLRISETLKTKRGLIAKGVKLSEMNASYPVFEEDRVYLRKSEKGEKQMKEMIAEFAIFANSFVGEYLKIHLNVGIFRTCNASAWLQNVYQGISGQDLLKEIISNGIKADYMSHVSSHDLVGMAEYCHFTSPIRRLADCVCHYLLKCIHLNLAMPFSESELEQYANMCLTVAKQDKKTQYLDIKFRLLQVIHNMLLAGEHVMLEYYVTSYSGLFLNVIISKINTFQTSNKTSDKTSEGSDSCEATKRSDSCFATKATFDVHMSYTLRVKKYDKPIEPKQMHCVEITRVNCFEKHDEHTLPELDARLLRG